MCSSMASKPSARARCAACVKSAISWRMSSAVIARGGASDGLCGTADGASGIQPPSAGSISAPPSQGRRLDALRPACDNWIASGIFETARSDVTTCCNAAWCSSLYRPRQPGVMRPSGVTAVASRQSRPAPDIARLPRCAKCQATGLPSSALYWHMGEIMIRLGNSSGPMRSGVNRVDGRFMGAGVPGGVERGTA